MTTLRTLAAALAAVAIVAAPSAQADVTADDFFLQFAEQPRLLPALHATERIAFPEDGRQYDYATKGYFKVAGRTVTRQPTFSGHGDAARERVRLQVSRATRHKVRAAAKRRGTRRVVLTLVHRLTQTETIQGDMAPSVSTTTQHINLTIPR